MKINLILVLLATLTASCECVPTEEVNTFYSAPDEVLDLEPGTETLTSKEYISVLENQDRGQLRISFEKTSRLPSDLESAALDQAIDYWNKAIGEVRLFRDDSNPNTFIRYTDLIVDDAGIPKSTRYNGRANIWIMQGEFNKYPVCKIQIRPTISETWAGYTHELGHCLGIGHSKSLESIMYGPCLNPYGRIVRESLELRQEISSQK